MKDLSGSIMEAKRVGRAMQAGNEEIVNRVMATGKESKNKVYDRN